MPPETPAPKPAPPLRLKLDEEALIANWRALYRLSGTARAGAAVKANGYGVGARRVVRALADAGCSDFFVACWMEAAEISDLVDPASISVLHGPMNRAEAAYAKAIGLRPVINTLAQAQCWLDAGGGACDLMVDTGINRLGLPVDALGNFAVQQLDVRVLMSHLASADEDSPLNELQRQRWVAARGMVAAPRASLANSAGIMLGVGYHGDLTRPGLSLYGGVPCAGLAPHIRQVVRPQAALLQVRQISAGESVGYNATFTARQATRIGVVSLGYADGYLCAWSGGKGVMRSGGAALPVLGRISMDMTVIDLSAALALEEGDWVDIDYALPQAAAQTGLSQYELLTLLGQRFTR